MCLEPHRAVLASRAVDTQPYGYVVPAHGRERSDTPGDQAAGRRAVRNPHAPARETPNLVLVYEDAMRDPRTLCRPADAFQPVDGLAPEVLQIPLFLRGLLRDVSRQPDVMLLGQFCRRLHKPRCGDRSPRRPTRDTHHRMGRAVVVRRDKSLGISQDRVRVLNHLGAEDLPRTRVPTDRDCTPSGMEPQADLPRSRNRCVDEIWPRMRIEIVCRRCAAAESEFSEANPGRHEGGLLVQAKPHLAPVRAHSRSGRLSAGPNARVRF